jgi:hypothetical protein
MKSPQSLLFASLTLAIFTGCTSADPATSDSTSPSSGEAHLEVNDSTQSMAPTEVSPEDRARSAKDALFDQLSTRLLASMSSEGPAKATEVCSKLAQKIAADVGHEHGVAIGRTGVRLRNTKNVAPVWAEPFLKELPQQPVFTKLEDGRTGALFPIMLKVQCLTCHGPADKIAEEIQSELVRLYPDDQATGFQEGELRGWFWVEVPAQESTDIPAAASDNI